MVTIFATMAGSFRSLVKRSLCPILEGVTMLPNFSTIQVERIVEEVKAKLDEGRNTINQIVSSQEPASWESVVLPLEQFDVAFSNFWSPISHLWSVMNTPELTEAFQSALPLISDFQTEMGQNRGLFKKMQSIKDSREFAAFSCQQKSVVENSLRDFYLSGIGLPEKERQLFKSLSSQLAKQQAQFEQNLLESGNAWQKHITDKALLKGIPESSIQMFEAAARQKGLEGWLITLDFPFYLPVMKYADNRALRRECYRAYSTRASEYCLDPEKWDNSSLIQSIVGLRHRLANLLSFPQYTHMSLYTKMADSPEQVFSFLNQLADVGKKAADKEMDQLKRFIREKAPHTDCQPWDVTYYSEKLKQELYQFSSEELRPFFPLNSVLNGLFKVAEKLFNITISEKKVENAWHEDVLFYEIHNESGQLQGQCYMDLFARPKKRAGAWMDTCRERFVPPCKAKDSAICPAQLPVAFLVCNFPPPVGETPSLLTHDDVLTLFHEFGHGLHHMLSQIDYPSVSGINGVPWDAVELPSQFLENWCWQEEALALFARHYQNKKPLPSDLFHKMRQARNFQAGMQLVRQLEFALFDFETHHHYRENTELDVMSILNSVRERVSVVDYPEWNRFPHSFNHVFGGGYAAGYYSYKWAEVLSADAFSLFLEKGVFHRETGISFKKNILEKGGSEPAMDLFVAFRGRKPQTEALLKDCGLL